MKNTKEIIIAHRGESYDAPENTLAAIKLAWERGAVSVEVDVHMTQDGQIVVIHDADTSRVANRKMILKKSLYADLKKLDVGSFKHIKWKGEQIPLLQEVLDTVPHAGRLIIEIKSNVDLLPRLKILLEKSKLKTDQIEIIAFDSKVLAEAKQIMPKYKMLWLLDLDYYLPWWLIFISKKRLIKKVKTLHLEGVNVWDGKLLTKDFICNFKKAGLLVYTWTVNNPTRAKQLIEYEIDAITTDRAAWITEQINKQIK
ncbi:glycerophosphodiester phosphodiesterase family protein [Labilibaculum sp.]|uniref:glycerophosphodiester phosphodiesterase family protein n=1 Tax=Labilibaculum sp. TaxID=2060723 RepID=UPI0035625F06